MSIPETTRMYRGEAMTLGPFASHPEDVIARHTARHTAGWELTHAFEHIIDSDESMAYRYGELQVLASRAIARVMLLENKANMNVVPIKRGKR